MGLQEKFQAVHARFDALKAVGRDPSSLEFDRMISPTEGVMNGKEMLLFGTNNYLGLTYNEEVINAAVEATKAFGSGTTGSRIANGTYGPHKALEAKVAEFYGMKHAMVFSTGYQANLGTITGIAGAGDRILIDADSHASIYDSCKMSGAEIIRFRHNNPADLLKKLNRLEGKPGLNLVVLEGIYSMLGDTAPLKEFAKVKHEAKVDSIFISDEAHGLGVLGEKGRGMVEAEDVMDDFDFITGTFSKSIGTVGGYVVSNMEGFEALRILSRPYMFTASPTPGVAASACKAFEIMMAKPELRTQLWENSRALFKGLNDLGFKTGPEPSPVVAVMLPTKEAAVAMWNTLMDAGVYTNIAIPPATPNALNLLRVSVSAAHRPEQIAHALEVFKTVGTALGVLAPSTADVDVAVAAGEVPTPANIAAAAKAASGR